MAQTDIPQINLDYAFSLRIDSGSRIVNRYARPRPTLTLELGPQAGAVRAASGRLLEHKPEGEAGRERVEMYRMGG